MVHAAILWHALPPRRILEIGCGTSTLSRDLHLYLRQKYVKRHQFHLVATDVSAVCIQQMRQRDAAYLKNANTPIHNQKEGLEYCVWNITSPIPPGFVDYFDVVLDKGCLDTFFFRSRTRGPGKFALMETFLGQVAACLHKNANGTSRYLCVSPRRKIKPLRDGILLQHVQPPRALPRDDNDLVEGDAERTTYYLRACCCRHSTKKNISDTASNKEQLPCDQDTCRSCQMTFWDFRNGEALQGRGSAFWSRRWKGHCQHCYGRSQPSG